jgi:peptide/nickel transport system ATP-binding protein
MEAPASHTVDQRTPILECRDVSISYFTRAGEVPAVVDFNLKLMPGEAHGLVGESGCGKSTIALAVMRYLGKNGRIVKGQILFEGRDILGMSGEELRRIRGAEIAMVYQEPMASLNPAMPIGGQLAEVPIFHSSADRREALAQARAMLERVRLADVDRIMRSYPHQISGGQQQRVVIAMALLSNPKVLLLDEPTTALDVTIESGIVDLIADISRQYGTAMLYVSHNLGLIRETCDTITVMYSGEAVENGPVPEVFAAVRHPYTRGLFASIPLPGADKNSRPLVAIPGQIPAPNDRPRGCFFGPRCEFFVAGRCDQGPVPMVDPAPPSARLSRCLRVGEIDWNGEHSKVMEHEPLALGETAIDVRNLGKSFGKVRANDDVTFDARVAETVAIVGESGCGKSTIAKILMGLETASEGSIRLADLELAQLPVGKRNRKTIRNLQMIFQNPFDTLNPSHSVGAQIARVIRKFGTASGEEAIRKRVLELLDLVKLPHDFARRRPRQLSGAFAGNPAVVVADEPVSALDVSVQAAVTELLMDIQRTEKTTLLFISHDLSVVRYLADRVVVMYLGRVMEQGRADEVFTAPYHPYTEALLSAVPIADSRVRKRKIVLSGEIPSPSSPPAGCPFSTRCLYSLGETCANIRPPVQAFSEMHTIACHLPRERLLAMPPVIDIPAAPVHEPPA